MAYSCLQKFAENAKTNFTPWELPEMTPEVALDDNYHSHSMHDNADAGNNS